MKHNEELRQKLYEKLDTDSHAEIVDFVLEERKQYAEHMVQQREKQLREDWEYLSSKINWGASFLDAKAINIMNNLINKEDE